MIAIFVSAKLFGEVAKRLGQPAVLGELFAGVLIGVSGLRLVDPHDAIIHLLAQFGVVLLLFLIGLNSELDRLVAVGVAAVIVAVLGVGLTFTAGFALARALGLPSLISIFLGASLTATSVGISARVLHDLGHLQDPEAQIVLAAAVVDDILGIILLTMIGRIAEGASALGDRSGSAVIVGAFAAGLLLGRTRAGKRIERVIREPAHFFIPIFFVVVGAAIDIKAISVRFLMLGIGLACVAAGSKFAAGFAATVAICGGP